MKFQYALHMLYNDFVVLWRLMMRSGRVHSVGGVRNMSDVGIQAVMARGPS